ncbi:MAG: hypothetical protein ABFD79_03090 [Phycisphaerales bacterium]
MRQAAIFVLAVIFMFTTAGISDFHFDLQEVDEYGVYTDSDIGTAKIYTIEGIILNKPHEMVNTAQQWQIFVQGENGDNAGTAVFMTKTNYPTSQIYTNADWLYEVNRADHNLNTAYRFKPGDRVRVTGLTWFYHGKTNINEQHQINPAYNFNIELLESSAGLPEPEVITLNMIVNEPNVPIFDHTRAAGCEKYQGMLVRINDVTILGSNWGPGQTMEIQDASGLRFNLLLGRGEGFTKYTKPQGQIDVIGIFDQESTIENPRIGYRLWVMNYDGNGSVLTDCGVTGYRFSDLNKDCLVDFEDFAMLAGDWMKCSNPYDNECTIP